MVFSDTPALELGIRLFQTPTLLETVLLRSSLNTLRFLVESHQLSMPGASG